jgi:hypothetical protein
VTAGATLLAVLALAGCGRFGFTSGPDDGGAGDGRSDGAADDAVVLDAASPVCPGFALVCDDFETGNFNKWSSVAADLEGTIDVTSTRVHAGTRSLEVTMPSQLNDAQRALVLSVPVQTTGTLAIKAWVNFPIALDRFNLIVVLRNPTTPQYATLGGNNMMPPVWVVNDNSAGGVLTDHNGTASAPTNIWVCVEYVFDFGARRVRAYVDGTTVVDTLVNDPAPAYGEIAIGVPRADAGGFHVFMDDIVIARQRIGCP